ncbi:hypothetical protein OROGR_011001 [Orobanche gracilis]
MMLQKSEEDKKGGHSPPNYGTSSSFCERNTKIKSGQNFEIEKPDSSFSNFKERLHHLQKTEKDKVCFGISEIHGWGLFALRNILEGEMVVEYRGD